MPGSPPWRSSSASTARASIPMPAGSAYDDAGAGCLGARRRIGFRRLMSNHPHTRRSSVKTPIVALATFIAASALAAFAADPPKKELTPQQQRMSDCAHESKGMKGDAHKQFMSDCL